MRQIEAAANYATVHGRSVHQQRTGFTGKAILTAELREDFILLNGRMLLLLHKGLLIKIGSAESLYSTCVAAWLHATFAVPPHNACLNSPELQNANQVQ